MKISVLTTDSNHPVVPHLEHWVEQTNREGHEAVLLFGRRALIGGDILFLVSCSEILKPDQRALFRAALVLHASDLPQGRGWSPHVWSVIRGANRITLSLVEAADPVDSGPIWLRTSFDLDGHELLPEINAKLFAAELHLMTRAVQEFDHLSPVPQEGDPGEYMRKRTPDDSRLDPSRTIAEQFDLLRVVDNERYPAFFDYKGHRYVLTINKAV